MKRNKFIILILLLFLVLGFSYAIYKIEVGFSVPRSVAKWNVKVKDKELKTPKVVDLEFTKDDIKWEANPKVKEGTIAPGSKGTITFNVDVTGTEVDTEIDVEVINNNNNKNIKVSTSDENTFIKVDNPNKIKPITINIEWLGLDDEESNALDNNEINKLFNISIKVTVKQKPKEDFQKTILSKFGGKEAVKAKPVPDFSKTAETNEGIFAENDEYGESYYYRGAADNWVDFAGFYWRIVRINGDGTIRLIYTGTKDRHSYDNTQIGEAVYNPDYMPENYAEYIYSDIKKMTDDWYKTNIYEKGYDHLVADSGFCNDLTKTSSNEFSAYDRLVNLKKPSFKCLDKENNFLTKENGKLTYPVGIISWDEVAFAGATTESINQKYYLYTLKYYWTMTPAKRRNRTIGYVGTNGNLHHLLVIYPYGVRPVINLKSGIAISGGDGTEANPYHIG